MVKTLWETCPTNYKTSKYLKHEKTYSKNFLYIVGKGHMRYMT